MCFDEFRKKNDGFWLRFERDMVVFVDFRNGGCTRKRGEELF